MVLIKSNMIRLPSKFHSNQLNSTNCNKLEPDRTPLLLQIDFISYQSIGVRTVYSIRIINLKDASMQTSCKQISPFEELDKLPIPEFIRKYFKIHT
ncbi:CLUMA_CG021132, isoform A [Clunio marinus]|uniref:CLUMA_CG021132, isoform A n=1 Tax=Clunio marinus TaxID=568069 RepID=A0A1J1J6T6_9DIPT|nr:CLUMA_CG021132, isoform A [Clunio marinus]